MRDDYTKMSNDELDEQAADLEDARRAWNDARPTLIAINRERERRAEVVRQEALLAKMSDQDKARIQELAQKIAAGKVESESGVKSMG